MGSVVTHHTRAVRLCIDSRALSELQTQVLWRSSGVARAVWNWALAEARTGHRARVAWVQNAAHKQAGNDEAAQVLLVDPQWRKAAYAQAAKEYPTYSAASADRRFTAAISDLADERWGWWRVEDHGVNRFVISSALSDLATAFRRYYTHANPHVTRRPRKDGMPAGYPRMKSRHHARPRFALFNVTAGGAAPTEKQRWRPIDGGHRIRLPSLGSVRIHQNTKRLRRMIRRGGTIKGAHVSYRGGRWYVALKVQMPGPEPSRAPNRHQRAAGVVGVDVGVKTLAMLSTGEALTHPDVLRRLERKKDRLTRIMQRRYRHGAPSQSARYRKARAQLARTYRRIADIRGGHLHQISKILVTKFQVVGVEDLNVIGMLARPAPKPDPDKVGHYLPNGRAAKTGLARRISGAGFYELRRQLSYKTRWYGSTLVVVGRYEPTSKTCSACGATKPKLSLAERIYHCDVCGHEQDRDHNAAVNIADLATAAIGASSSPDGETLNGRDNRTTPPGRTGSVRPRPTGSARPAMDRLPTTDAPSAFRQLA